MQTQPRYECHGHIMMDGTEYAAARRKHESAPDRSAVEASLAALREAGVCYFRDGGDPLGVSLLARQLAPSYGIEYVTPGFAIHRQGRYGGIVGRGYGDLDEYRALLAALGENGGDFVKLMFSGIITFREYGALSCPEVPAGEIGELIAAAHGEGYPVMAHVNGAAAIAAAARAGLDSVEHGYFADEAALEAMAENNVIWVPTLAAVEAFEHRPEADADVVRRTVEKQLEALERFAAMGGTVAAGSDSGAVGVPHGAGTLREYELLQKAGLTPEMISRGSRALAAKFCPGGGRA